MPDEFKNGGFTLRTNRTTPEEFKNATIISHLGFLFEKKLAQGNHMSIVTASFTQIKAPFSNSFSVHTKTQSRCFQIPPI